MEAIKMYADAIDWASVKVTLAFTAPCFIMGGEIMLALGILSVASNIVYNCIKIRNELKKKKGA